MNIGRGRRNRKKNRILAGLFIAGIFLVLVQVFCLIKSQKFDDEMGENWKSAVFSAGKKMFDRMWGQVYPSPLEWEEDGQMDNTEQIRKLIRREDDPAYRTAKVVEAFFREHPYLEIYGNEETGGPTQEDQERLTEAQKETEKEEANEEFAVSGAAFPGQVYQLAQLEDYDFLMNHFYSVHTSTTADRKLMDAKKLLSYDFRLEKDAQKAEGGREAQILIYHTHSQEAFADSQDGETIVAVGTYLTQLLEEKGFAVYHDCSVYDVRDGKLDRNKAYSYALEGITRILEQHPSIEVVIDLHRDGVREGTHLAAEVNGKSTAQIMFFNGLSQTPTGPIPYLDNPYLEENLAFSLQLQLKASAWYPNFTRKIYLKGLRYNLHLRPRSCLIEAGAQTNTYEEVKNAMEPLSEVLAMVLEGK